MSSFNHFPPDQYFRHRFLGTEYVYVASPTMLQGYDRIKIDFEFLPQCHDKICTIDFLEHPISKSTQVPPILFQTYVLVEILP